MTRCVFLDKETHHRISDARMALGKQRDAELAAAGLKSDKRWGWARFDEVTPPGSMWYAYWFYDPADPAEKQYRDNALAAIANGTFWTEGHNYYLSRMYWQQWSHIRPPILVLCPNGAEWCVDAKSSNGEGWTVSGDVPNITCNPSIAVTGYHGFLQSGVFTPDCEGRGSNGIAPEPWKL